MLQISGYRNLMKKDAEIILQYKDLTLELMWNVKIKLLSVIIGATGNISKSLIKCLNNITGKHDSRKLLTTAALGTVHVLRKEPM